MSIRMLQGILLCPLAPRQCEPEGFDVSQWMDRSKSADFEGVSARLV